MSWWEPSRRWRSGRWSLQVGEGGLEQIRFDGATLLRGIRAVVRDHDWATATLHLDEVADGEDSLDLAVHTMGLGARLAGHVRVRARDADLSVDLDLRSDGDVTTNRTGLVVLHPPELAGSEVQVVHSGGEAEQTVFPAPISPHQPIRQIRALQWASGGVGVQGWFDGDVFEMEDQRNWSDASYKTYNRPLALPFPYELRAGERVQQSVRVLARDPVGREGEATVHGAGRDASLAAAGPPRREGQDHPGATVHRETPDHPGATAPPEAQDQITLHLGAQFPDLQLGASTAPDPAPALPRKRAGALDTPERPAAPGAARVVELDLASPAWPAALHRAARAGLPLDVRLVFP